MFSTCARCSSRSRIAAASTSPPHPETVRSEDLNRRRQLVNLAVALLAICPVALHLAQTRGVRLGMTFLDGTSIRAHQKAAGAARKGALRRSGIIVKPWAGLGAGMGPRHA